MVKMTFTFDEVTAARLKHAAARLAKPQSEIVREAIRDYADRIGKLSEQSACAFFTRRYHAAKNSATFRPQRSTARSRPSARRVVKEDGENQWAAMIHLDARSSSMH